MKIKGADITVGDAGIQVTVTVDEDLTDYELTDLEFIFIKPTGGTFTKNPASKTQYTATYLTFSTDIDEEGEWYVYFRNLATGFEYNEGNNSFLARPKAEDMAKW